MKITRSALKVLISKQIAETNSVLLESPWGGSSPMVQADPGDQEQGPDSTPDDRELARQSLFHMAQQANQLHDMLQGDEGLEKWVKDKISMATKGLEEVFKAITYDKQNPEGR
tara:strand:- start:13700 stop:14038 length:339 start_codon:yes stop_codon:yes gene_type:complete